MPHPKETAYDELISPLMTQIIKLCKEHRINFAAQFAIGPHPDPDHSGSLLCTTAVVCDEDDTDGKAQIRNVAQAMRPFAQLVALTIRSS